jgi:hypothetical protein
MVPVIDPRDSEVGDPSSGNGTLSIGIRGGSTMMRITCPHCGRKSSTSKTIPRGTTAKAKCPGCGQVFRINAEGLELLEVLPTKAASLPRVEPAEVASPRASVPPVIKPDRITDVQTVPGTPFQRVIQVAVPERQRTNPVGIAALVLGIIAALIAWIPFLGLVAIPVGLLGALLGIIGLLLAILGRRSGLAPSLFGTAISLGSIVLSLMITGSTSKGISDALDKATQERGAAARPAALSQQLDASSKDSLNDSMQKMTANMTDVQKKQFAADSMTLTMSTMMKSAFQGAFSKGSPRAPNETEMFKTLHGLTADEIHAKADEIRRNMATVEAKEKVNVEALKKDRNAILQRAVKAMREAAAASFGTAESQEAQITTDQSGIKDFGEKKWEVTGQYVGPDKEGKKFRAPWTGTISFMFDSLQCTDIKLGDRQYSQSPAPEEGEPARPPDASQGWVSAPTPAKLGDLVVKVGSVKIDRVTLKGTTGKGRSKEPLLILSLEITNTNSNRKVDYRSWAGSDVSFERDFATLKDNNGNSYKRISFGIFDKPVGSVEAESIYPEKVLGDILVFEIPLKTAASLDLELPAGNVGEKGFFRIRIPASLVEQ